MQKETNHKKKTSLIVSTFFLHIDNMNVIDMVPACIIYQRCLSADLQ